jgi:hypothetical protein
MKKRIAILRQNAARGDGLGFIGELFVLENYSSVA